MLSLNKVMIIGNLGRAPEVRYTQGGDPVANFSVATTTRWRDDRGEQQEHTEWHDVVAWRGLAQVAADYLHKGSKVFVEGKLKTPLMGRQGRNEEVPHGDPSGSGDRARSAFALRLCGRFGGRVRRGFGGRSGGRGWF